MIMAKSLKALRDEIKQLEVKCAEAPTTFMADTITARNASIAYWVKIENRLAEARKELAEAEDRNARLQASISAEKAAKSQEKVVENKEGE
jgi:hypothetical protein